MKTVATAEMNVTAKDVAQLQAIARAAVELTLATDENPIVDVRHFVVHAIGPHDRPGIAAEFRGRVNPILIARADVDALRQPRLGEDQLQPRPISRHPDEA